MLFWFGLETTLIDACRESPQAVSQELPRHGAAEQFDAFVVNFFKRQLLNRVLRVNQFIMIG